METTHPRSPHECPDCEAVVKWGYLHVPGSCELCGQMFLPCDWRALNAAKHREDRLRYQLLQMRIKENAEHLSK